MDPNVEQLLTAQEPSVAALTRRLCEQIMRIYPDAMVTVEGGDIGFGSGTGYKGLVFTVTPNRAHVTLGVFGGASLPDPAGLLQGSGKVHRHVKIRYDADLDRAELAAIMTAAVSARR